MTRFIGPMDSRMDKLIHKYCPYGSYTHYKSLFTPQFLPLCPFSVRSITIIYVMVLCWLCFKVPSTARSFRDGTPHLLSLAKDVKFDKYTVPTGY